MNTITVYEGTARHRRLTPHVREFSPRLFLAYLDVDALPDSLDPLPGWSARHSALVRFRRRDFFDGRPGALGDAVRGLVEERLGRRPAGAGHLLAQLRTFGWLFNPLTVYYCWSADGGALDALVLEVTNTPWGERHWYVIDARADAGAHVAPKAMHVSPFLPMAVDYQVTWTVPGDTLQLDITVVRDGETMFTAGLELRRRVLDRRGALSVLVRHPALPLRVSLAIYRHALALFLSRVPVYRHPARAAEEVTA